MSDGHEVEVVSVDLHNLPALDFVWVNHPAYGQILLHRQHLTEDVAPPLPPEPPVGSVVLFGGEAVQRFVGDGARWAGVGSADLYTWQQLCEINKDAPVLLVPDPFAEPVELPWTGSTSYGAAVGCRPIDTQRVNVWIAPADAIATVATLEPDQARTFAEALWVAANAAEVTP